MKRKICIVTGTRAEYGLLYWLMKRIQKDKNLQLQIVATGMHLSPEFGLTYKQIEKDGFKIDGKVEMLLSGDTPTAISKSVGLAVISFADIFQILNPDIVVLLGDRFEIFAAAQTAMIMRIPIAHIHGGELTEGVIDDPIRHSITKMAHLHFTATEEYRQRVIQMGEQPKNVYNVGTLGIEGIKKLSLLDKDELSKNIGVKLEKFFLVTLHPTTLEKSTSEKQILTLLKALDKFSDYQVIFTKTNADTEGRIINYNIEKYVKENPKRAYVFDSLGQVRYLSAIKHCELVIGNSSSGLLEVPYFRKATINIGIRQQGRLKAESVIDCDFKEESIVNAINIGLSNEFKKRINNMKMLYGEGNTSEQIVEVLKNVDLEKILIKRFYDIEEYKWKY
ncbi:UDP-N-acetylglucosamine 2-epimerase [Ureibacillus thermosphaericus]|uniref:UDP-N-acetylglucosamine 2-epimerase (Non-hydrolyzing)/GDP/UDP-N,N'-diacetylbacillosamine 2-epimerase (Hydrolyzing) n=1 Tax=Ureibacillus thermosphaericus TaxID=51173 RepID=A0A840PTC6_URETH|nr:UDP-N-acetylglucosamine 2-epimerase [Ureibacillus thermosphaericus]MBB5149729.1 UDP-N-acetylglucosamine 2-epimerase (non-hydrolyzing)/GDP/UDP-N,N'-diacetylbacillosamine 2-epimerase (hydrolyzing) [Ureibacillus thermosphaericus]NKZ32637.1 UDP-N-acetylglucosamine 2-epimerase (hydrolyzing) [Ureibacillus thermosphaericus]